MSATTNNLSALVAALKSSDQSYIDACLKDPTSIKNGYIAEQGCYLIHNAIFYNQIELVRILVKNEENAKEKIDDKRKCAPLLHAVAHNRIDIVKLLVESNVNIHATNRVGANAVHYSVLLKDSAIMEYFLGNKDKPNIDAQDNNGFTPLHAAALCGKKKILASLLHSGANINAKNKDGMTALHYAAGKGLVEIIRSLLANNAEVSIQSIEKFTAADLAAQNGHMESLKLLLDHQPEAYATLKTGSTLLHNAVKGKTSKEVINFLLEKGMEINQQDSDQRTPLYYANDPLPVSILLEKGAEIDHQDSVQDTPLHFAIDEGAIEKIFLLLENGANYNLKNAEGDTAFDLLHAEDVLEIFERAYKTPLLPKRSNILVNLLKFMLTEELKEQLRKTLNLIKEPERVLLAQSIQENIVDRYLPAIAKLNDYDITTFFLNCSRKTLSRGANGKTVWEVAAEENYLESLRAFLNHPAFKNIKPSFQFYFMSSFMQAGNIEAIRMLLDTGVNLNPFCEKKGLPLLHKAIALEAKNRYEIVKLLLEKNKVGLNVNVYSLHKFTALHSVILCSDGASDVNKSDLFKIFNLLLAHGADIRLANEQGKTALSLIIEGEKLDFIKSLLDKGKTTTEEIIKVSNKTKGLSTSFKDILQRITAIEQEKKNVNRRKIEQLAQKKLTSTDYTYLDCDNKKGVYVIKIGFKKEKRHLFSLYCLLKENNYVKAYIDLKRKNICLQFSWNDDALRYLSIFLELFNTESRNNIDGRIENNYKKITKLFFPQAQEDSLSWELEEFFRKTTAQQFTENTKVAIKYKFDNEEDLKKCTSLLSIAGLQSTSLAKHIIVYCPLSLFLNSESCQQYCDNWRLEIEKAKALENTKNVVTEPLLAKKKKELESTSSQLPPELFPPLVIETYTMSFAPPEILAANQACQKANLYRRKNKKPQPLAEMLLLEEPTLEGPRPGNRGTCKKGTSSHHPAIRKLSEKTSSVKPDSPPLQQNILSSNAPISCSTRQFGFFSGEVKKEITDVHAKPDLILYPPAPEDVTIDFVTRAPKPKTKKLRNTFLAPTRSLTVMSPTERFEAYLTGYLDEYKHGIVNPLHLIRAIYYRIIHALITNLHNEIVPNYDELNRLRNKLVHDFCVRLEWDNGENRKSFLLKLADIFATKSIPGNVIIDEICNSIPGSETQDNKTLMACMNQELKHLKDSFKVFKSLGSKNQFFDGSQQYLVDSCLSSVSIISECVHILNKKNVGFPDLALFLDECRISIRNPAMHRCESTSSANPQDVDSIFNEKEKEACYQLLFGLSELSEFSEQSLKGCQPIAKFARK